MSQVLNDRIRTLHRRAVAVAWIRAAAMLVSMGVLALVIAGAVDWWLRPAGGVGRWALSLAVAIVVAGLARRWLVRLVRFARVGDVQVAQRVEQLVGPRAQGLSVAVDLASSPPVGTNSRGLAKAAIARAQEATAGAALRRLVNRRAATGAIAAAAILVVGAVVAAALRPDLVQTAARRLAFPWQPTTWPKTNELVLEPLPRVVAQGATLEIVVVDRQGRLRRPPRLEVQVGDWLEAASMQPDAAGRFSAFVYDIREPIAVRSVGGDDQTEWHAIGVSRPPAPQRTRCTIHPPSYIAAPALVTTGDIACWADSRLELSVAFDAPLARAELVVELAGEETRYPTAISGDGFTVDVGLEADWTATTSGHYWLDVAGPDGVAPLVAPGGALTVRRDQPPLVVIEPLPLGGHVTADSKIRVQLNVTDDLGIVDGTLEARAGAASVTLPLEDIAAVSGVARADGTSEPVTTTTSLEVDLGSIIATLEPSDTMELVAAVEDSRGTWAASRPLQLTLVARGELGVELARWLDEILADLERLIDQQRAAGRLAQQWGLDDVPGDAQSVGAVPESAEARLEQERTLRRAQLNVIEDLFRPASGLRDRFGAAREQITAHRLEMAALADPLDAALAALDGDGRVVAARIARAMGWTSPVTAAESGASQADLDSAAAIDGPRLVASQVELGQVLMRIAASFQSWTGQRAMAVELVELRDVQHELWRETLQQRATGLGRERGEMDHESGLRLDQLAARQESLRMSLGRLEAERLMNEPAAGGTGTTVAEAIQASMGAAATHIRANRISRALELQQQVLAELDRLVQAQARQAAGHEPAFARGDMDEPLAGDSLSEDQALLIDLDGLRKIYETQQAVLGETATWLARDLTNSAEADQWRAAARRLGPQQAALGQSLDRFVDSAWREAVPSAVPPPIPAVPGFESPAVPASESEPRTGQAGDADALQHQWLADLRAAALLMNDIAGQLANGESATAVHGAQERVVEQLARLLDQVSVAELQRGGLQRELQQGRREPGVQPEAGGQREADSAAGQPAGADGRGDDVAESRVGEGEGRRIEQVWGNLPQEIIDAVAASSTAEYLPKYARLIEEYYRRRAEAAQ